jgi:Protein of unknown function (DUF3256)
LGVQAQSMNDLFLKLPPDCSPSLSVAGRKELLKKGEFTIKENESGGDDYTMDTVTDSYMEYEYSYTSNDGGSSSFQLKKLKKSDGNYLLIFTRNRTNNDNTASPQLLVFDLKKNELLANKQSNLLSLLDMHTFIKKNLSDTTIAILTQSSTLSCDLEINSPDTITFNFIVSRDSDKKYLEGDRLILTWNGDTFTTNLVFNTEGN